MGLGLIVAVVILLYVLFWIGIVSISEPRWLKIAAVFAAVAIPFWDWPFGYLSFQYHCASEGGIRVAKAFKPQHQVFFDSIPSYSANELLKMGFKTVEITRLDGGGIARHEKGDQGQISTRVVDTAESPIRVTIQRNQVLAWHVKREDRFAYAHPSNELLAQYTAFRWRGGWLYEAFRPSPHFDLRCAVGPDDPIVLLLLRGA